jgi:Rhodopirellula transposase DDE domain
MMMLHINYSAEIKATMKTFYENLSEKDRRHYAAIEAMKLGYGGQKYICEVFGCNPDTVKTGVEELKKGLTEEDRIRKTGGGNKKTIERTTNIDEVFWEILKDNTAGSPMDKELKWTNLTIVAISKAFIAKGMNISEHVVKQLLEKHGFVERKMKKTVTLKETIHRDEQFKNIQKLKQEYEQSDNPIISIDVKKKR